MKKFIPYVILIIIPVFILLSWRNTFALKNSDEKSYKQHIESAEKYEEKKIYIDAVKEYEKALKINSDNYELAMKIADIYNTKLNMESNYINACKSAISADKTQSEPYIILSDLYDIDGEYQKEYEILEMALQNIENDEISEKMHKLKGMYTLISIKYDGISEFRTNDDNEKYAMVFQDGKKGLIDNERNVIAECEYDDIGILNNDLIPVMSGGEYYYINSDGYRKLVPDEKADYLGSFGNGYAPAKIGNMYGYLNENMEQFHFEYDYAGCFSDGIAAVKKDGKWAIINTSFKNVTDWIFDDVFLDAYGYCSDYNVFWGMTDGKYYLYNTDGEKISDGYDDVKQFATDNEPAAVKLDGKWGFISKNGDLIAEPEYDNANSFSAGYAPVEINGLWGCIDIEKNILIKPEFSYITSFFSDSTAIAYNDDIPAYLKINVYY